MIRVSFNQGFIWERQPKMKNQPKSDTVSRSQPASFFRSPWRHVVVFLYMAIAAIGRALRPQVGWMTINDPRDIIKTLSLKCQDPPQKRCVLSDWGLESLRYVLSSNGQMDPDGLVYTNCARWGSLFLRLAYLDMPWYDHLSLPAILWLKSNDKFDHIAPFSSWPSWELPMPATTYSHSIHWPWWCS